MESLANALGEFCDYFEQFLKDPSNYHEAVVREDEYENQMTMLFGSAEWRGRDRFDMFPLNEEMLAYVMKTFIEREIQSRVRKYITNSKCNDPDKYKRYHDVYELGEIYDEFKRLPLEDKLFYFDTTGPSEGGDGETTTLWMLMSAVAHEVFIQLRGDQIKDRAFMEAYLLHDYRVEKFDFGWIKSKPNTEFLERLNIHEEVAKQLRTEIGKNSLLDAFSRFYQYHKKLRQEDHESFLVFLFGSKTWRGLDKLEILELEMLARLMRDFLLQKNALHHFEGVLAG